jgi:hypothetical protein
MFVVIVSYIVPQWSKACLEQPPLGAGGVLLSLRKQTLADLHPRGTPRKSDVADVWWLVHRTASYSQKRSINPHLNLGRFKEFT